LTEPLLPVHDAPPAPQPVLGYTMMLVAATLFGLNGAVAKVALDSGLSSLRLTEARSAGAFLGLALALAVIRPGELRITRRELPFLIALGVAGIAMVQLLYFVAIHRLPVGVALLIQYLGPLLIALWARFVGGEAVRRRIWAALALSLIGLSLVVQIWTGVSFDGLGLAAAFASAVAFALYLLLAEHGVQRREPVGLLCLGFLFATLFWSAVQPWWSFPGDVVAQRVSLQGALDAVHLPVWSLILWIVVVGTIVPFALTVGALRHIPATRASIAAMLEPVVATVVAWAWLKESLATAQVAGAVVVLVAIALAQTAR
jgi:drug/metabolite transporter (DMT)-like permease